MNYFVYVRKKIFLYPTLHSITAWWDRSLGLHVRNMQINHELCLSSAITRFDNFFMPFYYTDLR